MSKSKDKKLEAFKKINVKDRLYIDMAGFTEYQTIVGPALSKASTSLIKHACVDFKNKKITFEDIKRMIISSVKAFPNVLPNVVKIESLPDSDFEELIKRFSALYV